MITEVVESPIFSSRTPIIRVSNDKEYKAAFGVIDSYFAKMNGDASNLTKEENEYFDELVLAIEAYQQQHDPIPTRQEFLMEDFQVGLWDSEHLRQFRDEYEFSLEELAEIIGVSVLEIVAAESGGLALARPVRIALDRLEGYMKAAIYG
jgi:DNA-binding XRE family transcriptional regulator